MLSTLVRLATSLPNYPNTTQTEGIMYGVTSPYSRLISKAAASSTNHEFDLIIDVSISFQSICLLRLSAELEGWANALRKEALQCLTVALCGTDTKRFWDLLTAYFWETEQEHLNIRVGVEKHGVPSC